MRRLAVCGALALALVLPAEAAAKKIRHEGTIVGAPEQVVKLTVVKRGSRLVKVSGFRFENVAFSCPRGERRYNGRTSAGMSVNRRDRFRERYVNDAGPLEVAGRLRRQGRRANGNIRATIDNCETGRIRYTTKPR